MHSEPSPTPPPRSPYWEEEEKLAAARKRWTMSDPEEIEAQMKRNREWRLANQERILASEKNSEG